VANKKDHREKKKKYNEKACRAGIMMVAVLPGGERKKNYSEH